MKESRLSRRLERQTKKNILVTITGIFIIIFLIAKFAIPLISSSTLFVINAKNPISSSNTNATFTSFVAPPVLDSMPNATNSAYIKITGTGQEKQTIKLYINDELVDKKDVEKNNRFSFSNIKINEGENTIKVKAVKNGKESSFSSEATVAFQKNPPKLTIDSPSDNQSFSKDDRFANVSGQTDPSAKVTVNDLWAIVDSDGKFSYKLPLQNGENKIKVVATDDAGNKTELERKVTYSP